MLGGFITEFKTRLWRKSEMMGRAYMLPSCAVIVDFVEKRYGVPKVERSNRFGYVASMISRREIDNG